MITGFQKGRYYKVAEGENETLLRCKTIHRDGRVSFEQPRYNADGAENATETAAHAIMVWTVGVGLVGTYNAEKPAYGMAALWEEVDPHCAFEVAQGIAERSTARWRKWEEDRALSEAIKQQEKNVAALAALEAGGTVVTTYTLPNGQRLHVATRGGVGWATLNFVRLNRKANKWDLFESWQVDYTIVAKMYDTRIDSRIRTEYVTVDEDTDPVTMFRLALVADRDWNSAE